MRQEWQKERPERQERQERQQRQQRQERQRRHAPDFRVWEEQRSASWGQQHDIRGDAGVEAETERLFLAKLDQAHLKLI
jgi:hypothetical protein